MKKFLLTLVAALGIFSASAQGFNMGDQVVTAAIGLNGSSTPITISYEKAIYSFAADHLLGVGGAATLYTGTTAVSAEANYHYVGFNKFDLYGGLNLGWNLVSGGGLFNSFHIGSNYFINNNIAINLEAGYGLALGVTYKF